MKKHLPNWLVLLLFFTIIIRIPTLFMPYTYGDEMIYLTLGEGIRQGLTLYKDIHDNKLPLIYILAAITGSLFWFKFLLLLANIASIYLFYKLTEKLFPKKNSLHKISTLIFIILTNLPLLEGNIVNSEILMLLPTLSAILIILQKDLTYRKTFIAGLIFSLAPLLKIPAIFDIPAIIIIWFISQKNINLKETKKTIIKSFLFLLGVTLPILATIIWYFSKGAMLAYTKAAFLENMGYLSSWRGLSKSQVPFFVKNGPLLIRFIILSISLTVLILLRKKLNKSFVFVTSWLFLTLFSATLSERPYPHYLVQTIPAISILFALLFTEKSSLQTLSIIPLTIFFFVPFYFKFWYYPSLPFYKNFIMFLTGKIDKKTYINNFDRNADRNYKIAKIIQESTSKKDRIFVWEDSSQIYALSKRLPPIKYVAGYHIKDFSDKKSLINNLNQNKPKLIIILPESEPLPELERFAEENYLEIKWPEIKEYKTRVFLLPNNVE